MAGLTLYIYTYIYIYIYILDAAPPWRVRCHGASGIGLTLNPFCFQEQRCQSAAAAVHNARDVDGDAKHATQPPLPVGESFADPKLFTTTARHRFVTFKGMYILMYHTAYICIYVYICLHIDIYAYFSIARRIVCQSRATRHSCSQLSHRPSRWNTYTCIYIYMYIFIYLFIFIWVYIFTTAARNCLLTLQGETLTHVYIYIYVYIYTYIYIYIYIYMSVYCSSARRTVCPSLATQGVGLGWTLKGALCA